jgi:hypothetical protein
VRYRVGLLTVAYSLVLVANSYATSILVSTGPDQLAFGPGNLPTNEATVPPYAEVDIFTLPSNSTVTQIDWSAWVNPGSPPTSLDWAITTNLASGGSLMTGLSNVVASGMASSLSNTLTASNVATTHSDVYWSEFSVNVPLVGGTYYLWLGGVTPLAGGPGWGYASNTGGDSQQWRNGAPLFVGNGRLSFELDGTTTAVSGVPEPATLTLTALGLTGLARQYRRRRS